MDELPRFNCEFTKDDAFCRLVPVAQSKGSVKVEEELDILEDDDELGEFCFKVNSEPPSKADSSAQISIDVKSETGVLA